MNAKELYDAHLAQAAPGTPLHASMQKVGISADVTVDELIAYAQWEMWEAIYSLPPESAIKGDPRHATGDASRITDGFHASCCIARADGALRLLTKLNPIATDSNTIVIELGSAEDPDEFEWVCDELYRQYARRRP